MSSDEDQHETSSSGASNTFPQQAGAIKKGGFVVMKDCPCRVIDVSTSKTGKHGHAKVHMFAVDIFTGKKYEEVCPSSHNMDVPNITRKDYQLNDIDHDGFLELIDDKGELKKDVKLLEGEEGDSLREAFKQSQADNTTINVNIISAMGFEAVGSFKVEK